MVLAGQQIAEPTGSLSLHVHAPTSGKIVETGRALTPWGRSCPRVILEPDLADRPHPDIVDMGSEVPEEQWWELLTSAGIMLQGPTPWPLSAVLERFRQREKRVLVIQCLDQGIHGISAASCLTTWPEVIRSGLEAIRILCQPQQVLALVDATRHGRNITNQLGNDIEYLPITDAYPAMLPSVTSRLVSGHPIRGDQGQLEADPLVLDITTLFHAGQRIRLRRPLLDSIVTVGGYGLARPQVLRARIGTPVRDLIDQAGGLVGIVGKIILNDVLTGVAIVDLNAPVTATLFSVIVLPRKICRPREIVPCIACGECVEACPAHLEPVFIEQALERLDLATLNRLRVKHCISCGICGWVCPSMRPLFEKVVVAKHRLQRDEALHNPGHVDSTAIIQSGREGDHHE